MNSRGLSARCQADAPNGPSDFACEVSTQVGWLRGSQHMHQLTRIDIASHKAECIAHLTCVISRLDTEGTFTMAQVIRKRVRKSDGREDLNTCTNSRSSTSAVQVTRHADRAQELDDCESLDSCNDPLQSKSPATKPDILHCESVTHD
jgi:hypothetical protein